jgi:hypothetical protein
VLGLNKLESSSRIVSEVGKDGVALLSEREVIKKLIQSHTTTNKQQLKCMLELISVLMEQINTPEFEKNQLHALIDSV